MASSPLALSLESVLFGGSSPAFAPVTMGKSRSLALNLDDYSDDSDDSEVEHSSFAKSQALKKVSNITATRASNMKSPLREPAAEPAPSSERLGAVPIPSAKRVAKSDLASQTPRIASVSSLSAACASVKPEAGAEAWPWSRKESSKYKGRFYYMNELTGVSSWTPPVMQEPAKKLSVAIETAESESDFSTAVETGEESSDNSTETEPDADALYETDDFKAVAPTRQASSVSSAPAVSAAVPFASLAVAELLRWRTFATSAQEDFVLTTASADEVATTSTVASSQSSSSRKKMTSRRRTADAGRTSSNTVEPSSGLQVSGSSWAAQQRLRRAGGVADSLEAAADADVVRKVKSLLNKLSVEKFPQLSKQLLEVGFTSVRQVSILITEIFEKATTQHHYIDMYTDLCELMNDFFGNHAISMDPKFAFKRLLLNECQRTFEANLVPPPGLEKLDPEDRQLAEIRYKTRMLGCIRFVGALLSRQMLASKVLISIVQDLMFDPTPEALETLAALLTVSGKVFDTRDWAYHEQLCAIFSRLKEVAKGKACCTRVRCIIQDLLDLRACGWQDSRPNRAEAPTTLEAVAAKAKEESRGVKPAASRR